MEKVVLGLSDGVDSAVAAELLKRQDYDVHGVYMDIAGKEGRDAAMKSAARLGIECEAADVSAEMERYVKGPFREAYLRGMTPNPCLVCNPNVKLALLLRRADGLGARYIATGHYAVCDGKYIYAGRESCDQSYMLCRVTDEQVSRLLLPLGTYEKSEVRRMAREWGFPSADKPDSRENCFIKGRSYREWIEEGGSFPGPGDALIDGVPVARHEGIHRYTVGQRWPEDYGGRRYYVSGIDAANDTVTLVKWEELFKTEFTARELHFIGGAIDAPFTANVRVRHTRWEMPLCTVYPDGDTAFIVASEPFRAPAPGQIAAFYIDGRLVGSARISADAPLRLCRGK